MSIEIQVLGQPGEDNAVLMRIDSGSSIHRLLFDCGEKCLDALGMSEIQSIDHLFFSHYHMDHVCGFDTFFRHNYNRPDQPVTIWGPPGSIDLMHHRMSGFTWNLHRDQPGEWIVNQLEENRLQTARFLTRDAFAKTPVASHPVEDGTFLINRDFSVSARFLDHGSIPSLAYRIDQPVRKNIDPAKLDSLGLKPGSWIRDLKECRDENGQIEIEGQSYAVAELQNSLLTETKGKSAAYLTDFIISPESKEWESTCDWLRGVDTLVCEGQFRESDHELAARHSHMTAKRVGQLASDAGAGKLLIQHVSRRYDATEWIEMREEARSVFPETEFPGTWNLPEKGVGSTNNG